MAKRRLSRAQRERALRQCQADYDSAKARLAQCGFICGGSLSEIYTCCLNPNCRCADPANRHGPYWQLTWKEAGKTVSRRLTAEEAELPVGPWRLAGSAQRQFGGRRQVDLRRLPPQMKPHWARRALAES